VCADRCRGAPRGQTQINPKQWIQKMPGRPFFSRANPPTGVDEHGSLSTTSGRLRDGRNIGYGRWPTTFTADSIRHRVPAGSGQRCCGESAGGLGTALPTEPPECGSALWTGVFGGRAPGRSLGREVCEARAGRKSRAAPGGPLLRPLPPGRASAPPVQALAGEGSAVVQRINMGEGCGRDYPSPIRMTCGLVPPMARNAPPPDDGPRLSPETVRDLADKPVQFEDEKAYERALYGSRRRPRAGRCGRTKGEDRHARFPDQQQSRQARTERRLH
jgi:hypothetical protein